MGKLKDMAKHIELPTHERTKLAQLVKTGTHSARVLSRARVLLLLDRSEGQQRTLVQVAEAGMVSASTVSKLKKRYFRGGLERALYDRPRPGAEPKIDGEVEAHLIAIACSDPPAGHARWSLRLLADRLVSLTVVESISHTAVATTLKKMRSNRGG